jgi:Spy/CpxP family protein refolding chaperone
MVCLALGLGALGFIAMRKARCCHMAHHHGWGGPPWAYGWQGGWHHRGPGRRMLFAMLAHLDASPAQERAIVQEVDKLRERMRAARAGVKDARGDLAAAVRGPNLDDAALGAVLGRVDATTAEMRTAVLEALRNIHAVLDDHQRQQLADLLDHGGWWRRGGGPGGGPYRV